MHVIAATKIDYDLVADRIMLTGRTLRTRRSAVLRDIQDHPRAVTIIRRDVIGWGDHNAIIDVDWEPGDAAGGYYLAKIED